MKPRFLAGFTLALLAASAVSAQEPSGAWELFRKLVLLPGVSGQESEVAGFIQGALPRDLKAERDEMDNLWFSLGSGSPHLLFVAHTDELGWTVESVTADGRIKVREVGSMLARAAEGRAVNIFTDRGPVPGIVGPRAGYDLRRTAASPPPR